MRQNQISKQGNIPGSDLGTIAYHITHFMRKHNNDVPKAVNDLVNGQALSDEVRESLQKVFTQWYRITGKIMDLIDEEFKVESLMRIISARHLEFSLFG